MDELWGCFDCWMKSLALLFMCRPTFEFGTRQIRQTKEISGIMINKKQYKLSSFADDLLLYLTNVNTSVPHLMEVIAKFSKISGYKMNIWKTELMVVNPCKTDSDSSKQYLGCYISSDKKTVV